MVNFIQEWGTYSIICRTRELSVPPLALEALVAPVVKSDSAFDLQTDIIFWC